MRKIITPPPEAWAKIYFKAPTFPRGINSSTLVAAVTFQAWEEPAPDQFKMRHHGGPLGCGRPLRAVVFILQLILLVGFSRQSDDICDLPGLTMEYPNVKVEGTYRMKMLTNGPQQSPPGTCSIYCKRDKSLYFRDDEGREKEVTANNLAAPVGVKGSYGELLKLSRTTSSMASYVTMDDGVGDVFESRIGHESSTGTGVFGGGSAYALSIGTSSDHAISFHTSGKASPRLFIGKYE